MSLFGRKRLRNRKIVKTALSNPIGKMYFPNRAGTYSCIRLKASMTVEAAVALPLFIGFMVFLMFYFRMMQVQIGMEQAMAYTARITAAAAKETSEVIPPLRMKTLLYAGMAREDVPTEYIDGGRLGISLSDADYTGAEIKLRVSYRMTLPIGFFGNHTYTVKQEVVSRKWTGRLNADEMAQEENYVYVTSTGKAYHKKRDCTYLNLSIQKTNISHIKEKRNENGSRYKPCSRCGANARGYGICYITDYGNYYHRNIDCHGLKRTIYMIPLREVGNRHGCGKCMGG